MSDNPQYSLLSSKFLDETVSKPTITTHFPRSLPPVAQKLVTLICYHLQKAKANEDGSYSIHTRFVKDVIGWARSGNYTAILDGFEDLHTKPIKWNVLGKDKTVREELSVILLPTVHTDKGSGIITFDVNPRLKPLIDSPLVFAKMKLIMMAILDTPRTAYPLYELICDAHCRGEHQFSISKDDLYVYLGVDEVETYKKEFKLFNNRILKKSCEQINLNTDYEVQYRTYRKGRSIAGVTFDINKKHNWQIPFLFEPTDKDEKDTKKRQQKANSVRMALRAYEKFYGNAIEASGQPPLPVDGKSQSIRIELKKNKISDKVVNKAFDNWGIDGIEEIIAYVEEQVETRKGTDNSIRRKSSYLAQALKDGAGIKSDEERQINKRSQSVAEKTTRLMQNKDNARKAKEKAQISLAKSVKLAVNDLPTDVYREWEHDFQLSLQENEMSTVFEAKGTSMAHYDILLQGFCEDKAKNTMNHLKLEIFLDEECEAYGVSWAELNNHITSAEKELKDKVNA